MDIRENATYPYPIWGLHDDFIGPKPDGEYKMYLDDATNDFVLNYNVTIMNEGINRLISENKAIYKCIIECVPTYYLQIHEQPTPQIEVRIPADKVFKRLTVKILIIATQDIKGCNYLNVDEIYEGVVDYPKGGVIADIDKITFNLQQKDNNTDLSNIFRTLAAEVDNVEYDVQGQRVVIKYPKALKDTFDSVEDICPAVIESAFVFPALVYALSVLHNYYPSDKNWVYYLTNIVDDYFISKGVYDRDSYEFEPEEIYDIANASLSKVHSVLLEEVKRVIDQAMEE